MTYEEAIKIISRKSSIPNNNETFETVSEAYDMAIEALEKQVPKKPILFVSDRYDYLHAAYKCPNCKDEVETVNDGEPYCSQCGQALLREDTE